jgi:N-acetylglutamate synthase-like GNAT family acetyltransferase
MIRLANKFDKDGIMDLMRMFRDESPIQQYKDLNNVEYISRLLDTLIAGQGVIYIEENVGMIIGVIQPTIWCDKTFALYELAWYVKPENRNTSVGYRLLSAYVLHAKKLKDEGRIKLFTMNKMITSPDIKYEKFGFTKIEEGWLQ